MKNSRNRQWNLKGCRGGVKVDAAGEGEEKVDAAAEEGDLGEGGTFNCDDALGEGDFNEGGGDFNKGEGDFKDEGDVEGDFNEGGGDLNCDEGGGDFNCDEGGGDFNMEAAGDGEDF